jgi:hypothetical protein
MPDTSVGGGSGLGGASEGGGTGTLGGDAASRDGADGALGCTGADASGRASGWYFDTTDFFITARTDLDGGTPPLVTTQVDCTTGALTINLHCNNTWHDSIDLAVSTGIADLTDQQLTINATATALNWYKLYSKDPVWSWSDSGTVSWSTTDITRPWDKGAGTGWPIREIGAQFGCPAQADQSDVTIMLRSFGYSPLSTPEAGSSEAGGDGATSEAGGDSATSEADSNDGQTATDSGSPEAGVQTLYFDSTPNYSVSPEGPVTITSQTVDSAGALNVVVHCSTDWTGDILVTLNPQSPPLVLTDSELTMHARATGSSTPAINWYKMFTQLDPNWAWVDSSGPSPTTSDISFSWNRGTGTSWVIRSVGAQLSCPLAGDYTFVIDSFTYLHL